jgi:tight adherence protein C
MPLDLELFKLGGTVLTFLVVSYAFHVVLRMRSQRASIRAGLRAAAYTDPTAVDNRSVVMGMSFKKRVMRPGVDRLAGLIYRFGPSGLREQTKQRLILAGISDRIDPDVFFAISALAPAIVAGGMAYLGSQLEGGIYWPLWVFVPVSPMLPKMWLTSRVESRQRRIRLALSDTLDMLTIAVEAGLGFDSALARVAGTVPGPLSDELFRMLQELRIGIPRSQAFKNLSQRTGVQELDEFITAMNQADSFGISVGRVLRVQAERLRKRRSQKAEERAAKTPVKLVFPLVLCIFPPLFTVLVGPAAIMIMDQLFSQY